jgi:hypothetical protein
MTETLPQNGFVDKDQLFVRRIPEQDVVIPGVGTVRVRALTRDEALSLTGKEMPQKRMERQMLAMALVAPRLTEEEVGQWQRQSGAGELQVVVQTITALSGLTEDATKSDLPEVPDES